MSPQDCCRIDPHALDDAAVFYETKRQRGGDGKVPSPHEVAWAAREKEGLAGTGIDQKHMPAARLHITLLRHTTNGTTLGGRSIEDKDAGILTSRSHGGRISEDFGKRQTMHAACIICATWGSFSQDSDKGDFIAIENNRLHGYICSVCDKEDFGNADKFTTLSKARKTGTCSKQVELKVAKILTLHSGVHPRDITHLPEHLLSRQHNLQTVKREGWKAWYAQPTMDAKPELLVPGVKATGVLQKHFGKCIPVGALFDPRKELFKYSRMKGLSTAEEIEWTNNFYCACCARLWLRAILDRKDDKKIRFGVCNVPMAKSLGWHLCEFC
jgi:hypothetical protein